MYRLAKFDDVEVGKVLAQAQSFENELDQSGSHMLSRYERLAASVLEQTKQDVRRLVRKGFMDGQLKLTASFKEVSNFLSTVEAKQLENFLHKGDVDVWMEAIGLNDIGGREAIAKINYRALGRSQKKVSRA